MKNKTGTVYFAHGKYGKPWGNKITRLANIAKSKGYDVYSPDYSKITDPDKRVKKLLNVCSPELKNLVLVGSSMGGYVSTIASKDLSVQKLFLMAPAFYVAGYKEQDPEPFASNMVVIHGLNDETIPVKNSIKFSTKYNTQLHLLEDGHRLSNEINLIESIFTWFLDK